MWLVFLYRYKNYLSYRMTKQIKLYPWSVWEPLFEMPGNQWSKYLYEFNIYHINIWSEWLAIKHYQHLSSTTILLIILTPIFIYIHEFLPFMAHGWIALCSTFNMTNNEASTHLRQIALTLQHTCVIVLIGLCHDF